jgi:hypothetical protein
MQERVRRVSTENDAQAAHQQASTVAQTECQHSGHEQTPR